MRLAQPGEPASSRHLAQEARAPHTMTSMQSRGLDLSCPSTPTMHRNAGVRGEPSVSPTGGEDIAGHGPCLLTLPRNKNLIGQKRVTFSSRADPPPRGLHSPGQAADADTPVAWGKALGPVPILSPLPMTWALAPHSSGSPEAVASWGHLSASTSPNPGLAEPGVRNTVCGVSPVTFVVPAQEPSPCLRKGSLATATWGESWSLDGGCLTQEPDPNLPGWPCLPGRRGVDPGQDIPPAWAMRVPQELSRN
nr:uncharacterized protein LOC105861559 [Microcebus murinus]